MEQPRETGQRRMAAVMFADIMGYTALMHADEEHALTVLNHFKEALDSHVPRARGEIIQFYGDGCLVSFTTAADAVRCAREIQLLFQQGIRVPVRIGIHMGDVVYKAGNAYGDSVNIASRIESMGIPGGVLFSEPVKNQIRNQNLGAISLGSYTFKNLSHPMEVFALEHEGIPVPKKSAIQGKFRERPKRNYISMAVAVAALLGFGYMIWKNFGRAEGAEANAEVPVVKALAIFPFAHDDHDSELSYLSDGIPGNLINRLSTVSDLRVYSRNATFTMRDSVLDFEKVRDLLDADVALTGQVDRINEYLIVDCQLIDVRSANQIWGQRIRTKAIDLMQLEDSLVTALMHPLKLQLTTGQSMALRKTEIDPVAYDHYMQGRHLSYGSTLEESEKAIDHFRKAIGIEPRYAEAYAAIANEKIVQAMFSTASREEIFGEARTAAQSALGIDPALAEANLVKASLAFYADFDWQGTDAAYRRAYETNPNDPTTLIRYSAYLAAMGRNDEAMELARRAVQLDPVSISSLHNLGWVALLAKDYHRSKRAFGKALELHPNWIWGHTKKGYAHVRLQECDTASMLADRGLELLGEWGSEVLRATFISINYDCGNLKKAQEQSDIFFSHVEEHGYEDPLSVMFVHYAKGEYDTAFDWAERMIEERSPSVYLLIIESFWKEEFFQLPRYQALLRRVGV